MSGRSEPKHIIIHEFLLLFLNLAQLKDKARIMDIFLEAINSRDLGIEVIFSEENIFSGGEFEKVATIDSFFGYCGFKGDLIKSDPDLMQVIRNFVRIVAILLENLERRMLVKKERNNLEKKVMERVSEIKNKNEQLEDEIHKRKTAEEVLLKEKYILSKAQEIGLVGSWILEAGGNKLIWSDETYRIFGLPVGTELVYETFLDRVHPDDREYVDREWKAAFSGKPYDIEHRIIVDGNIRWVREKAELEFDEKGQHVRGVGFTQDITDRKRSEQALQASEAFLDRVIEQSPFATWISDAEGTLQRANPALKKFLNLTDEQLVGKYNVLKDPLVERQGLMPLFRSVFEEGKTIKFTCDWDGNDIPTMDLKGSKSVSIEAAMFPILTPAGKLTNVVLNWIDITDRKKAEKELRDSEKKSRTWLEYSPVCTKIVDLDLNLQFMSKAGVEGLRIDDITPFYGKPYPFSFYPKAFRDLMTKNLQKVKNTGEIVTQEAPVVDVEGNEVWFHSTLVPVNDDEGRIEHIMVVSVDTTERNKAEQELKKAKNEIEQWSKELEKRVRMQIEELKHSQEQLIVSEKLATIGRLAAGVAHELNSPLSGLLSLFRTYRKRGSVSVGEKEWGEILSACEYMAKVINDLNIFARTSGVEKEGLDLVEVLDSVMSFGLSRTKLKSAVVNRLYAGKSIKSKGDKGRLQQVFLNVLNNAVDAIPEGGRVNIDAGMTDQEGNSFAEIEFTDNGSGMSSETLEHIFDPFYTTKKAGEGVGLGMSIVHTIVKEHGGKITIDSSEGKGTTIKILLPPDTLAE